MNNETIVIGGGLGGLSAATYLARGGRRTRLLEKASHVGGRAQSQVDRGFSLNLGPHALYNKGPAEAALRELGVAIEGGAPKTSGSYAWLGQRSYMLPAGPFSLLATGLLSAFAKLELGRFLAHASRVDPRTIDGISVREWARGLVTDATALAFVDALARVTTYTNAPDLLSAGVFVEQLQRVSRHNVTYLHGGWTRLVEGLRAAAEGAGVVIESGAKAVAIEARASRATGGAQGHVSGVRVADGRVLPASAVVVAASPSVAHALAPDDAAIAAFAARAVPVEASCLGVALSSLPAPKAKFLLGVDAPIYVSVHSAIASLAPEGAGLVEVARYLAPGEAAASEDDLLRALEALQPGATERVVFKRYLPRMTVAHDVARADARGLGARATVDAADTAGLLLVGDWVGPAGLLADASLSSARAAAHCLLEATANESVAA